MELSDQWSCYYCFCFLPNVCLKMFSCTDTVHNFCDFIHCYDVFDGSGKYNLTSCRKNKYQGHYCINNYETNRLDDRCCGCLIGPCWTWPVMAINCFNLTIIKNIDRCCASLQDDFCYQGKCCYSKKQDELQKRNRIQLEQDLTRRIEQASTEDEVSQSGFSYDGQGEQPSTDPSSEYWMRPPLEELAIPPPYPGTISTQV